MNTHTIIISVVVILFVGALWAVFPDNNGRGALTETAAVLNAQETYFDFGNISMRDGVVSHSFSIQNEGEETITIKKVYTSCMCTSAFIIDGKGKRYGGFGMQGHGGASVAGIEVKPKESVTVEALFDPAAHGPSGVGLAQRSVYLETNSQKLPSVELRFSAMVTR